MLDTNELKKAVEEIDNLEALEKLEVEYLGRNGKVNDLASKIKQIDPKERKEYGQNLNKIKSEIEEIIKTKKSSFEFSQASAKYINIGDVLPKKVSAPRLHPTTITIREIRKYFEYLGYSIYEGPEIETDEYNFNKLNLPKDHPARDLQDTLYISEPEYLLRTHTSSVETRCMTQEKLPLRIIVPGKCYRNESVNASNNAIFYQLEGLVIDKGIHVGHLRATLEGFAKFLYGENIKTRFRCKYYPQVEPGAGMDIECTLCKGKGCAVCKYRGFIEALGAGMVHPQALRNCGIDPAIYSGFAFGMGLDRLVMMKFGIKDIRKLYSGELVWKE